MANFWFYDSATIAAWAAVTVAGAGVFVSVLQFIGLRRANQAANRSAAAAEAAVVESQRNIKVFTESERGRITIELEGLRFNVGQTNFNFGLLARNTGRTPLTIEQSCLEIQVQNPIPISVPKEYSRPVWVDRVKVVNPKAYVVAGGYDSPLAHIPDVMIFVAPDEYSRPGGPAIFIRGHIRYRTIYGQKFRFNFGGWYDVKNDVFRTQGFPMCNAEEEETHMAKWPPKV